jgi:hypothetical protein
VSTDPVVVGIVLLVVRRQVSAGAATVGNVVGAGGGMGELK